MEQNVFDAIMWWVVGLAIFTVVAFLMIGLLKGYIWDKEDQVRHRRSRPTHRYSS
jgi:hypothetical protein